ncbi:MAG: hypothetical protein ACK4MT_11100, partial [Thermaurantiacus tibetensis]
MASGKTGGLMAGGAVQVDDAGAASRARAGPIAAHLLRDGVVSSDDMLQALAHRGREAGRLPDVLRARGLVVEQDLLQAQAQSWGIRLVDLGKALPDPRLIDAVGPAD